MHDPGFFGQLLVQRRGDRSVCHGQPDHVPIALAPPKMDRQYGQPARQPLPGIDRIRHRAYLRDTVHGLFGHPVHWPAVLFQAFRQDDPA